MQNSRSGFQVPGFGVRVSGCACSPQIPRRIRGDPLAPRFRVSRFGSRVSVFRIRVPGFRFRCSGFGDWILTVKFRPRISFYVRISGCARMPRTSQARPVGIRWNRSSRFRISGSSFRISGPKFRDWVSGILVPGFGLRVSGFGFRVPGFGFRVSGLGIRCSGFCFQVSVCGLRVSSAGFGRRSADFEFRVSGFTCQNTKTMKSFIWLINRFILCIINLHAAHVPGEVCRDPLEACRVALQGVQLHPLFRGGGWNFSHDNMGFDRVK